MLQLLSYILFIICVALAAGGIVLSSRLRIKHRQEVFSTLLYYQVFIFTFGFYGLWGQVVIKSFFSAYLTEEMLTRLSDVALLLGLPFLVFAWLMLLQFTRELSGRKNNNWYVLWFLLMNLSVIIVLGYLIARVKDIHPVVLIRYYFIAMQFIYSFIASVFILFPGKQKKIIHEYDGRRVGIITFLIMIVQCLALAIYDSQPITGALFIFVYFAGHAFLPVYFNYATLLTGLSAEPQADPSFEKFCVKYEVSPRESDIVREICNGLSNKEISEKLFISLQTVKDHTHRIYIKTNVKSRVQLIYLVKELKTQL